MPIIDVYGHVALPRFLSAEDLLRIMDANGVEAAVLSTAETCPDTLGLSQALVAHPDRFRAIGMPLGRDAVHQRDAIKAQLDSGFSGIRLPAAYIAENPDVLELLGGAGASPIVVGPSGLSLAAREVADFLDRFPGSFAIAGHFGGPAPPALLDENADVGRLFDHPRLHVAFTRHSAMAGLPLDEWASALVRRCGWDRLVWGSEWPVALWRNETYQDTLDWALRLNPSPEALEAFRYGNAKRLFFAGAAPRVQALDAEWDLMPFRRQADVWLFPPSLDLTEERHRALFHAYEAWGGDRRGRYSEFVLAMTERGIAADKMEKTGP